MTAKLKTRFLILVFAFVLGIFSLADDAMCATALPYRPMPLLLIHGGHASAKDAFPKLFSAMASQGVVSFASSVSSADGGIEFFSREIFDRRNQTQNLESYISSIPPSSNTNDMFTRNLDHINFGEGESWLKKLKDQYEERQGAGTWPGQFKIAADSYGPSAVRQMLTSPAYDTLSLGGVVIKNSVRQSLFNEGAYRGMVGANIVNSYTTYKALMSLLILESSLTATLNTVGYITSCRPIISSSFPFLPSVQCDQSYLDRANAAFELQSRSVFGIFMTDLTVLAAELASAATGHPHRAGSDILKDEEIDSDILGTINGHDSRTPLSVQIGNQYGAGQLTGQKDFTVSGIQGVLNEAFFYPVSAVHTARGWFGDGDGMVSLFSSTGVGIGSLQVPFSRGYNVSFHGNLTERDGVVADGIKFLDPANSVFIKKVNELEEAEPKLYLVSDVNGGIKIGADIQDYLLRKYPAAITGLAPTLNVNTDISVSNNLRSTFSHYSQFGTEAFTGFEPNSDASEEVGHTVLNNVPIVGGDNTIRITSTNYATLISEDQAIIRTPHIESPRANGAVPNGIVGIGGYAFSVSPSTFVDYSLGASSNKTFELFEDSAKALTTTNFEITYFTSDGSTPLENADQIIGDIFYVDAPNTSELVPAGAKHWYVRFAAGDPDHVTELHFSAKIKENQTFQTFNTGSIALNNFTSLPVSRPISIDAPFVSSDQVLSLGSPFLGHWDTTSLSDESYKLRLDVHRVEGSQYLTFTTTVDNILVFRNANGFPLVSARVADEGAEFGPLVTNPANANDSSSTKVFLRGFDGTGPGIDHYEIGITSTSFAEIPVVIPTPTTTVPNDFNLSNENVLQFIQNNGAAIQTRVSFVNIGSIRANANGFTSESSVSGFEIPNLCDIDFRAVYFLFYRAVDSAGNVGPMRTTVLRYVPNADEVAPTTLVTFVPSLVQPNDYAKPGTVLTFVAQEPRVCGAVSGISETVLVVNGVTHVFPAPQGANSASVNYALTEEGIYIFEYYSIDLDGNVETHQTKTVRLDLTHPESAGQELGIQIGQKQCIPTQPGLIDRPLVVRSDTPFNFSGIDPLSPIPVSLSSVASGISSFLYRMSKVTPAVEIGGEALASVGELSGITATSLAVFLPGGITNTVIGSDGDYEILWAAVDRVGNTDLPTDFNLALQGPASTSNQGFLVSNTRVVTLDNTRPVVHLLSPSPDNRGVCRVVNGVVKVTGTFTDLHFQDYKVDYAPGTSPDASSFVVITAVAGTQVLEGWLATWNTTHLSPGFYTLRITGRDCVQNTASTSATVYVGPRPTRTLRIDGHAHWKGWKHEHHGKPYLDHPSHVAVYSPLSSSADCEQIFVTDEQHGRVLIFGADGFLIGKFGSQGHSHGRFNHPSGIAISALGEVFVADSNNARIQVFDLQGHFKRSFGKRGHGLGEFNQPMGLALDGAGNLWVADRNNNRVQKLSPDGHFLAKITGLKKPEDVSVDAFAGKIHVADSGADKVRRYTQDLHQDLVLDGKGEFHHDKFRRPVAVLANARGYIYVSDDQDNRVIKFDRFGNRILDWELDRGHGHREKSRHHGRGHDGHESHDGDPLGLAEDAAGNLFVANGHGPEVIRYSLPGTVVSSANCGYPAVHGGPDPDLEQPPVFILSLGSRGSETGKFKSPSSVAVDGQGALVVLDTGNDRIQKFDKDGNILWTKGERGSRPGDFKDPRALALGPGGTIFVADTGNSRVQIFNDRGELTGSLGEDGRHGKKLKSPSAIGVDANGKVYVGDSGLHQVLAFTSAGARAGTWKLDGNKGQDPGALAALSDGTVLLAFKGGADVYSLASGGDLDHEFTAKDERKRKLEIGGLSTDGEGSVYVADLGRSRVYKYGAERLRWVLGRFGADEGEFDQPKGTAMDLEDNLWVADSGNHRLQKFGLADPLLAGAGSVATGQSEGLSAWPNPFSPFNGQSTVIRYVLDSDVDVKLSILNPTGQTVFSWDIDSGLSGARKGNNEVPWNGMDQGGRIVGAGRYTLRLAVPGSALLTAPLEVSAGLNAGSANVGVTSLSLSGLSVSPNPAKHRRKVSIRYTLSKNANVSVRVTDKHGRLDYSFSAQAGQTGGQAGVNILGQYDAGNEGLDPYTVQVTATDGSQTVSRSVQLRVDDHDHHHHDHH